MKSYFSETRSETGRLTQKESRQKDKQKQKWAKTNTIAEIMKTCRYRRQQS